MFNRWRPAAPAVVADDARGRRLLLVIECIVNQNARDRGAASFPALNFELIQLCHAHQVGILQMPCPEIAALGCQRTRRAGQSIRAALDSEAGRRVCAELATGVADRLAAYLAEGYELLAVLGGNPHSPGCAVADGTPNGRSGVFIGKLQQELHERKVRVVFKGIRDGTPELLEQDLRWLRQQLERPLPSAAAVP